MIDPRARRLQFITGKGGVGKSTLAAALGLAWAERGRRPLVVELGERASMNGIFGSVNVGWEPVEVAPGVHATAVDTRRAVLEVFVRWLRIRALAERAVRHEALQAFVGAAPGVTEVATIERIISLLEAGFDPVIVDADASGHALMFLELPRVLEELGVGGPVAALIARTRRLFGDSHDAALHLVTLPGALPVQETIELDHKLRTEHRMPHGALFVSRAPRISSLSPERLTMFRAYAERGGQVALSLDLARLAAELSRADEARARLERLRDVTGRTTITLPELPSKVLDRTALLELGRAALEGLA
jgi:hypothetical protein